MNEIEKRVLRSFAHWKDRLDLHTLLKSERTTEARTAVFDSVERLVKEGLLQEEGNDFYSLTEKGRKASMMMRWSLDLGLGSLNFELCT